MGSAFKLTGSYILAGNLIEPGEKLNALASHNNPAVRRRLAENPGTPAETLAHCRWGEQDFFGIRTVKEGADGAVELERAQEGKSLLGHDAVGCAA